VRWTHADAAQFNLLGAISRRLTPLMPCRFKVMGPAHLRWRQRAIDRGPLGDQGATTSASGPAAASAA
jgi:uncharacterized protein (DUF2236 family)